MDFATLGIRVTSDGIEETDAKLKNLSNTGQKASAVFDEFGDGGGSGGRMPIPKKIKRTSDAINELGNTAKQNVFAMRQLPMQMTDIFTGLATGQSPMMVLLQQGGQLKDVFGGIGPAVRSVGGYIAGLINPLTIAAGAAGVLGTAFFKGREESEAMSKALVLSGNRIGETISGLANKAGDVARITGGTIGKASEVLAAFAQSGQIARSQLVSVTEAAINFEKAGGQAIEKTGEQFKAIAGDPLQAITALTKQYNFLTPSTLNHIAALQKAGDKASAAKLATDEYAKALNKMASDLEKNKGIIEKAWDAIGSAANKAWDAMLGVGRERTSGQAVIAAIDNISQIEARIAKLQSSQNRGPGQERELAALQAGLDKSKEYLRTANQRLAAENQAADAAEKNAKATAAAADAIAKASENARKAEERLKALTAAWIDQADQVISFKDLDQQTIEASAARSDALQKEADKYKTLADPTAELRKELERIQELGSTIDPVSKQYVLSSDQMEKATARVNKQIEDAQNKLQGWDEFAKSAARNVQSAFADFLFDPFQGGLQGMAQNFANIVRRMAAEAAAANLSRALFGGAAQGGSGTGLLGNLFGSFGNDLSSSGSEFVQSFMPGAPDGSSVVDLGGSIADYLGSFATGIDYIPRDGWAHLHKGERVVTAAENSGSMAGGGSGVNLQVNVQNNVGADVSVSQRQTPQGPALEVMIDRATAKRSNTPGSAMNRTLTQRGARLPLVTR